MSETDEFVRKNGLKAALQEAESTLKAITEGRTGSGNRSAGEGIEICESVERIGEREGAFAAKNEELDDIGVGNIKLLRIHFIHGSLLLNSNQPPGQEERRVENLRKGIEHLNLFVEEAKRLGIVKPNEVLMIDDNLLANISEAEKRTMRINALKLKKESKLLVSNLEEKAKKLKQNEDDDEEEREKWIAVIRMEALESVEEIGSSKRELKMLEEIVLMKKNGSFERQRLKEQAERERERSDPRNKPITITQQTISSMTTTTTTTAAPSTTNNSIVQKYEDKLRMKSEVFRDGHSKPTMTPEEAADIEMEQARMKAKQDDQNESERKTKQKEKEDKEEEDDEDVRKQRQWDNWKDNHPRGSGNTIGQG